MENCSFGWLNWILSAALSADDELPALPVSNLANQQGAPSLGWRTSGTQAVLTIAASGLVPWRAFGLHRTNLSASAIMSVEVTSGGSVAGSWQSAGSVRAGQCLAIAPAEVTGDTARVTISDPDNPDGFLSIPLAYAGPLWQPVRNFSTESTETMTVGQQTVNTLSGGEFVDPRYVQRGLSIAHQSYGDADAVTLRQIQRAAATGQNILFVSDPSSDPATLAETALFGRLAGGDLSSPFGPADRHSLTLTLTERL